MSGGGFMTSALTAALEERDQLRAEVERLNQTLEAECRACAASLLRAQRLEAALREAHEVIASCDPGITYEMRREALAAIDAALAEEPKPAPVACICPPCLYCDVGFADAQDCSCPPCPACDAEEPKP